MMRRCCDEFSRRAVAGAGLRAIEPGHADFPPARA